MRNLLIEASAGTGKTQALGEHLIKLLNAGVKPEEMVALTFSRAAAGEIFDRFVSLLAERREWQLLRRVIATQHLSQIGTLDSFLARLVRAFPEELGLTGEIEMMDTYEADRACASLSFRILRKTEAKLKKTFTDAFMLAMNHEHVRSFVESYRTFISNWHKLVAAHPDASAWGEAKTIWGKDVAFAHVGERELAVAAERVRAAFPADARWLDFAAAVESFRGPFDLLKKGYASKLIGNPALLEDEVVSFVFSRKTITLTREETLIVRDAVICVYGYQLRRKLELAKGIYKLLSAFERAYDGEVRKSGKLVFDDVPRLLKNLSADRRLALEYRLDCRIRAWALDEFQDTSRDQWNALKNLLAEAKQASDKSVFIVGDSKQAIYGWREGDVSIFASERDSSAYEKLKLAKTYRSSPVIVEAVNRVFTRGRILDSFPRWQSPEHESARPELKGFVNVMEAAGSKQADFIEPVLTALKARPQGSAAVLVRNNSFGELLARELRLRGLKDVVWEGESVILDTPALAPFLDLVRLADHPGDLLTYRHFSRTRLAEAMFPSGVPAVAELSALVANRLTTRGLVRTFKEWRVALPASADEAWSAFTEERFIELLRAAADFERGVKAGTRLADFADFLASRRRRTVAEPGKIKIMTIHRSKGLGFDFVVLPLYEPDGLGIGRHRPPLVGEDWVLPDPGEVTAMSVGGLEHAAKELADRAEQEALCLYYVAMTRAKSAMAIVLHPAPKKASDALRFSDLVRGADLSDLSGVGVVTAEVREAAARVPSTWRELLPPAREARKRIRRRLPSLGFQPGMSAGSLFLPNDSRARALSYGLEAHKRLEAVEFSPELPRPEGFVELWRERAFEVFAEGEWISGRFDRVVFFRTPAGLAAEIVDFKTSLAHPEHYDAQLKSYRLAVSALTGIPLSRITARLMKI